MIQVSALQTTYNNMEQDITIDQLIKGLPIEERIPVIALKQYYDQRGAFDAEQQQQMLVVRNKYVEKIKPLLDRASELIQGNVPTAEQVAQLSNYLKPGEKIGNIKGKVIEGYWNGAFQNSALEPYISEQDEHALEYLLNIQLVSDTTNPASLNFKFTFKANPYFQAGSVTRRLRLFQDNPIGLQGDLLNFKPGVWLTHEPRKVKNKKTGETKVTIGAKRQSFFDIFLNWTAVDNPDELMKCAKIFEELDMVVRESFSYFLGLYEMDESVDEQDYEEDELEEDESHGKGRKK